MRHFLIISACVALGVFIAYTTYTYSKASFVKSEEKYNMNDIETKYISKKVEPGNDFYSFTNDGWLKTAKLPNGYAHFGQFVALDLNVKTQLKSIIDDIGNPSGKIDSTEIQSEKSQISALYSSFLNTKHIESLGVTPLHNKIKEVLALETHEQIARQMGKIGYTSVIGFGITINPIDPDHYICNIMQSGLGLPERSYYLRDDAPFPEYRRAYIEYIRSVFDRANIYESENVINGVGIIDNKNDNKKRAEDVFALELALAKVHWTGEQLRDVLKNYHVIQINDLHKFAPGFSWADFLEELGIRKEREIIVRTDSAIKAVAQLFNATPVDTLRSYLIFHILSNHASFLPSAWDEAHFNFYEKLLQGTKQQRQREDRGIDLVNSLLGEPLGKVYVTKFFSPEWKNAVEELVRYLRAAFRNRLEKVDWMDDSTCTEALIKLDNLQFKIGYPEVWHDYSSIKVSANDLIGNIYNIQKWAWDDELLKLSGARRKWEWGISPQVVNAFYGSLENEMTFPAAILQEPFFNPNADPLTNFGVIGAVIGHEMTHAFDDEGSHFDGSGTLRNWWTDKSRKQFNERAAKLAAQYSKFSPINGMYVNGQLTLGENIADLGGMLIAYDAYESYMRDHNGGTNKNEKGNSNDGCKNNDGKECDSAVTPISTNNFTKKQSFFIAYSQLWRGIMTDEYLRKMLLQDPHSPYMYRVNGVLRNVDAWYDNFNVTSNGSLYLSPIERVRIW